MKIGAEDRRKLIAAIVLMTIAVFSLVWVLSRPHTPAAAAPRPFTPGPTKRPTPRRAGTQVAAPAEQSLDPTLRLGLLHASEDVRYAGTGRNIFRAQAEEPPKPVKSPLLAATPSPLPTPTGPPPPPPINLKFYGFANKPGEAGKKIFLAEGDNIFIAGEGDVVNRRYKVVHIGQNSVEIEDLLNNNRQTIPLSQS